MYVIKLVPIEVIITYSQMMKYIEIPFQGETRLKEFPQPGFYPFMSLVPFRSLIGILLAILFPYS